MASVDGLEFDFSFAHRNAEFFCVLGTKHSFLVRVGSHVPPSSSVLTEPRGFASVRLAMANILLVMQSLKKILKGAGWGFDP